MTPIPSKHTLLVILAIFSSDCFQSSVVASGSCDDVDTGSIITSQIECQLHDTIIDLNDYAANITNRAIHIIPDVASVKRCGGNCNRPSHRCIPINKRFRQIPVMAILSNHPRGIHETECGHIQVEEHTSCQCDCPITPNECTREGVARRFDANTCKCLCTDMAARGRCIARGMYWDESNCRCVCPISQWRSCSTGYVFDYQNTCHCMPTSMTASLGLIAATIVLITCMLGSMVGIFVMYRKKTGLFRTARSLQRLQYNRHKDSIQNSLIVNGEQRTLKTEGNLSIIKEPRNTQT